jgi:hypothetical protein
MALFPSSPTRPRANSRMSHKVPSEICCTKEISTLKKISLMIVALSLGTSLLAKSCEPNLDETVLFLTKAITNHGILRGAVANPGMKGIPNHLTRSGTILTYTAGMVPKDGRPPNGTILSGFAQLVITFDLNSLDPTRVKVSRAGKSNVFCVSLDATNSEKVISVATPMSEMKSTDMWTSVDVCFRGKNIADRSARAFQHAIELSGRKPSVLEPAQ